MLFKHDILPVGFTDNLSVLFGVFFWNSLQKKAYWHFNSVLATDQSFKEALSYFWTGFGKRKVEFTCLKQWWDYGKTENKMFCQQHMLNVTYHIASSIRDLETEIVELELLNESTENQGYIDVLKTKKVALASLLDTRV